MKLQNTCEPKICIQFALSGAPGDCIELAADVPFIACVINFSCTFNHYLDMSSL